jgi:small subunit ribosomal protein S15
MAKMHSRKRGRSRSRKLLVPKKPTWLSYGAKELEMLIVKLAKEAKTSAQIGLLLRDSYGVPSVKQLLGKTISQVMQDKKLAPVVPEDLSALIKRATQIKKHREQNKKDNSALRGLQFTESKIHRLAKYYKANGKLPLEWKYEKE